MAMKHARDAAVTIGRQDQGARDMDIGDAALAPGLVEAALDQPVYRDARYEVRVRDLIAVLGRAGKRVFVVGGAPRDWLVGLPGKDIDLALDCGVDEALRLLRDAYPDADAAAVRMRNDRFGVVRWGDPASGAVDLNILRSWRDIQGSDMWTTTFVARSDLVEDALMRDFSVNAFYYDCAAQMLLDPLRCGIQDLREKSLRIIAHPRVLEASYRMTFRIAQFLSRGYAPTPNVLEYLERHADRDIQGMGARIRRWTPEQLRVERDQQAAFKGVLYAHARQAASIETLDAFFA
ncbi:MULTISPECIES: CCA tRNA nucleotidyltransferase [Xanthomonas]|uniref:CCA tRNA nucleotidyltransferase n=1 Tax=Xanthomonas TaxID=338 RepID=UPI001FD071CB|nr:MULTISPECIES: CCA tRNA nucleotidyltransferase [unclassified Xanthomonas]WNH43194.1 CCA tRNA nucleotidyltransferase [Xanthomonas sp. A6251]